MTPLDPLPHLSGTWHIIATTLPFWRGKRAPRVTYEALDGRWRDTVEHARGRVVGFDRVGADGWIDWRGSGWLGWISSRWAFVAAEPDWVGTWFTRATLGVTPEGMDVYTREPNPDDAVVAAAIARMEALSPLRGWYRTER